MRVSSHIFWLVLFAASTVLAQNYGGTNQGATNALPGAAQVQGTNGRATPPAPPSLPVAPPQVSDAAGAEKPAVRITAQGTVLTDEQKRLISQKLQEIPGVVVITNRIRVVGGISEAAGANRTNGGSTNRSPSRRNGF